jgi:Ca-activated chloride channel homolog
MFSFASPWWLPAGILACLLLWLWWQQMERRRRLQLARFAAPSLLDQLTASVCPRRRIAKKLLVTGAVFCCFVALAEPHYGSRWIAVKHKGIDILFALDSSRSMLAPDVRPNRLERSKLAIMDFVERLDGDRIGLLPFAGTSHLLCPLTADYQVFSQSLQAVDSALLPVGGTDIGGAIKTAEAVLANDANHKLLVIITDGEDLGTEAAATAQAAHSRGMTIFTIGVGTTAGELIPDPADGGFIKDDSGTYVRTKLDRQTLTMIAQQGGGIYADLGNRGEGLDTVYRERLALIPEKQFAEKRKKVPISRSEWPLALALALLCSDFLLSARKQQHSLHQAIARLKNLRKTCITLLLLIIGTSLLGSGPSAASEGERAFANGDYQQAEAFYRELLADDPDNPILLYNSGSAAYKNAHFDSAIEAFSRAITTAAPAVQEKAYFNQGNSWYRAGEMTRQTAAKQTIQAWQNALNAFAAAVALNPDNRDAAANHEFVTKQLERLRRETENSPELPQDKAPQGASKHKTDEPAGRDRQEMPDQETGEPEDQGRQDPPGEETGEVEGEGRQEAADLPEAPTGDPRNEDDRTDESENGSSLSAGRPSVPVAQAETTDEQVRYHEQHEPGNTARAMTRDEAQRLLQAIEGEQGRLDLAVPDRTNQKNLSDW